MMKDWFLGYRFIGYVSGSFLLFYFIFSIIKPSVNAVAVIALSFLAGIYDAIKNFKSRMRNQHWTIRKEHENLWVFESNLIQGTKYWMQTKHITLIEKGVGYNVIHLSDGSQFVGRFNQMLEELILNIN